MDEITRAVREMYEAFPYPTGAPVMRLSSDARLVLSRGRLAPPVGRPLHALDAGCGRGLGALGLASLQPDVHFTAIDLNRVALEEARAEAARRGLRNVQFAEIDLMTLEGLQRPAGGFDVIYSSGVLHHLSDPARGLALLRGALAPHGVLVVMVYGRPGREPLYRMVRAIDALIPRDRPLRERLAVGRALAASGAGEPLATGPWGDAARIDDVEFVDRYLNVNETSYDLDALFSLVEGAGMQFLQWCAPADWDVGALLPPGPLRERALALPLPARHRLVEQLCWRPKLELLLCQPGNGPRPPPTREALEATLLAVSPEVTFDVRTRNLQGSQRTEAITLREGTAPPSPLDGPLGVAALVLRDQLEPFRGGALVTELARFGLSRDAALEVIGALLARGVLYAPHD